MRSTSKILNILLFVFVSSFAPIFSTAQNHQKIAKELFDDQNYEEALRYYRQIYTLYPNDPQFQYYLGACLTETQSYESKTRKLLLNAAQHDVPERVFFYIAINYHAMSDFQTALEYYNRFADLSKKREKKNLQFDHFYDLCSRRENPFDQSAETGSRIDTVAQRVDLTINVPGFSSADTTPPSVVSEKQTKPESINEAQAEAPEQPDPDKAEPAKIPEALLDTVLNVVLSTQIRYKSIKQFKTDEGLAHYIEAWKSEVEIKNKLLRLNELRKEYSETTAADKKQEIAGKVTRMELENIQLKNDAGRNYSLSQQAEMTFWRSAPESAVVQLLAQNDSIKTAGSQKVEKEQKEEEVKELVPHDTVSLANNSKIQVKEVEEEEKANEVIYRIQIGAYSKELPEYIDRLYKKLSVLRKIDHYTDERGVVVYTVGELRDFDDAVQLQKQIRQEGVKDAFVVAYNNGKRITLKEAREIE